MAVMSVLQNLSNIEEESDKTQGPRKIKGSVISAVRRKPTFRIFTDPLKQAESNNGQNMTGIRRASKEDDGSILRDCTILQFSHLTTLTQLPNLLLPCQSADSQKRKCHKKRKDLDRNTHPCIPNPEFICPTTGKTGKSERAGERWPK